MNRRRTTFLVVAAAALLAVIGITAAVVHGSWASPPSDCAAADRPANIRPDYTDITIPPNIAPLNFAINEPGDRFVARFRCGESSFDVAADGSKVVIPKDSWSSLLKSHAGQMLQIDIFARDAGGWKRFPTIRNTIAAEPIDRYLSYRQIDPNVHSNEKMSILERDLESFSQREILNSKYFSPGCTNCHSTCNQSGDRFLLHVRARGAKINAGTVIVADGRARLMTRKIPGNNNPVAFPAWHPNGKVIAFSINLIGIMTVGTGNMPWDEVDFVSDLVLYDVVKDKLIEEPKIADKGRLETFPAWSADGRTLYFCSAVQPWTVSGDRPAAPYSQVKQTKYDLVRIEYDSDKGTFGQLETVLSAGQVNKSILAPRCSPDGKWLMFCMSKYGSMPVFQPSSDLYAMNLVSGAYHPLAHNSPEGDSWHSWSSNSRWFVFSSRRDTAGHFARTYIAYFDPAGGDSKPFVLPQESPEFYEDFPYSFNVPELAKTPLAIDEKQILDLILPTQSVTGATKKAK